MSHPPVGALVAITPPAQLARFLDRRRYLPIGVPLLKHVAARPGTQVCRFSSRVTIDRHVVAIALDRDSHGRPLPAWRGCRILGRAEFFLLNAAADSMDGRYFGPIRSEEHTSELQSLMRISYAVFCLKKKTLTHYKTKL